MNLYVVRSKEGKFFRPVGMGGGQCWQTELSRAKFYPKIGPAKGQVTFFSKHYSKFGVPDILEFTLDPASARVIDMTEITVKVLEKQASSKANASAAQIKHEIAELEKRLSNLKKK